MTSYPELYGREPRQGDEPWAWLLTITFAGRTFRWSSRELELLDEDGDDIAVEPSLGDDIEVDAELPLGSGVGGGRQASFEVYFPEDFDVSAHEARGHRLAGAPCELALVPVGGTLSDRRLVLTGFVSQPSFGDVDEAVAFTCRGSIEDPDAEFPPDEWKVGFDTFPVVGDASPPRESRGKPYVFVWGAPGRFVDSDGNAAEAAGTPAIPIYAEEGNDGERVVNELLISAGKVAATVVNFRFKDDTAPEGYRQTFLDVHHQVDELGTAYSFIDLKTEWPDSGSGDPYDYRKAGDYYIVWGAASIDEVYPAVPLNGVERPGCGQLALWWLEQSSKPVDYERSIKAAAKLDAFRFDGFVNDTTSPEEWIADHLADKLPCYLVEGPRGLYLVHVPFVAEAEAVAHLVVGDDGDGTVERTGRIEVTRDGRATKIVVRWARDLADDTWLRTTTWTTNVQDPASQQQMPPDLSRDRREAPRTVTVELPHCWDAGTAQLVAEWTAWRECSAKREVDLVVDVSRWGWLLEGEVVLVTDPSVHLEAAPAIVLRVKQSDRAWWPVRLLLLY